MARRSRKKTEWQAIGGSYWTRWSRDGQRKSIVILWGKQWQAMFKNRDNISAAKTLFFDTKQEAIAAGDKWLNE